MKGSMGRQQIGDMFGMFCISREKGTPKYKRRTETMPKNFTIEIQGSKPLIDLFSDLPKQFTTQVMGDVAQKGASVIRSEARRTMPLDGELGRVGKKAVIIAKNRQNKSERIITIGGTYVNYKGKMISIGKVIRHMTAGNQGMRKTAGGQYRGKVSLRLGDFIQKAFERKKDQAVEVMQSSFQKIIEKRASRLK